MIVFIFLCVPDSNPKYVSLFHFFHRNVYGTQLNLTLEGNRIDDTIYSLIVHFKCLYHFFSKLLSIPLFFLIMELVNEQNNRQLTMQIQLTYTNWTDICKCLINSCEELTHWKRPWCWEGLGAGGEGDDRGWDGWMASLTQWTWVWVNSGSWWWTGRLGVLWFMGLQRVRHNWETELNWTESLQRFHSEETNKQTKCAL